MTAKTELLRCTKEGSNVFFLLNYFKESKDLQYNPSVLETPGVWNPSQILGSKFTYLEPLGQELEPLKNEVKWAFS